MREACPRCGAQRPSLGACPECGYEDPHPGVLGSYRRAFGELVARPSLLVPFLAPTLLIVALRLVTFLGASNGTAQGTVLEGLAGVVVLFLGLTWYFVAAASVVPSREQGRPEMPAGPTYVASAAAAGLVALPLLGFVLLVGLVGPASLGALGLLGSILLLFAALVLAGRAVGLPVEAALSGDWGLSTLSAGNERARERGGLGLVFLALLLLVPLALAGPIVQAVLPEPWAGAVVLAVTVLGLTVVGAWAGLAFAIGLAGGDVGVEATFECPACGETARVEGGRARCECGLEGPYYPGPRP